MMIGLLPDVAVIVTAVVSVGLGHDASKAAIIFCDVLAVPTFSFYHALFVPFGIVDAAAVVPDLPDAHRHHAASLLLFPRARARIILARKSASTQFALSLSLRSLRRSRV